MRRVMVPGDDGRKGGGMAIGGRKKGMFLQKLARALRFGRNVAATIAAAALLFEYGFRFPEWAVTILHYLEFLVVLLFVGHGLVSWAAASDRRTYARDHRLELTLIGLLGSAVVVAYLVWPSGPMGEMLRAMKLPTLGTLFIGLVQIYILTQMLLFVTGLQERIASRQVRPPLILIGSFTALILIGSLLLWLPRARVPERAPLSFVDALFTSTSATCVTGLTTRDTGSDFSRTGQFIILGLIQVGGLGLVFFTAFFASLQQRSMGLRHLVVLRDLLSANMIGELGRYLRYVLVITLSMEALGTALLWTACDTPGLPPGDRLQWSAFHSVSAFCNAGFSLQSDSFMRQGGNFTINATLMLLIVAGGLGFPILMNLLNFRSRRTIQTRLALVVSASLIAGGALLFWTMEARGVLAGRPAGEQALGAMFHSVSARTAGFNTVDIAALATPTLLLLIALMFVGASPASTGGGVKTITVAVLAGTVWSMMRNRRNVEIFRRTIPRMFVNAAVTIMVVYVLEAFAFTIVLTVLQPSIPLRQVLFEVVSALSTVGLSTGITASLDAPAKLVLCGAMLAGRVGPLAILMSIAGRAQTAGYEYPAEDVIVA